MEETERRGKQGMTVGGTFPTDLRLKIMFKAIGTLRMMQHPEMQLEPEIENQVVRSDLYGGNAKGLRKSQDRDKAATSLVEYLDRVLRHQDHSLTSQGHRYFGELISEVIGNAEEHSGRWYTRAFSQPGVLENGQQLEQCHLVIINFGKTIFESLSARGSSHEVRKRIDALVEHHTRKRFFQPKWDEECLWTVYALQQGVSRYADTRKGPTRGNGTIRMIEAFSRLAVKPQEMCILSGSAFVMYDGTYKLYEAEIGGEKLSQISFNKQSDLAYPPGRELRIQVKKIFSGEHNQFKILPKFSPS